MISSEDVTDYILSAVASRRFESAIRLCEIFFIKSKSKFSFLYGLANINTQDIKLLANIIGSNTFAEGFRQECGEALEEWNCCLPENQKNIDVEPLILKLKNSINDNCSKFSELISSKFTTLHFKISLFSSN